MNKKIFSIKKATKESWGIVKSQFGKFLLISIILSVVSAAFGFIESQSALVSFVSFLLQTYITIIWVLVGIRSIEKKKLVFRDVFKEIELSKFFTFMVLTFIVWILVAVGLVLLIVPGIIIAIALQYAGYFMLDKGLGIRASIKASWKATKGARWKLFLFLIVIGLINLLGLLVVGVGIFVTIPLSTLMISHVYVHSLRDRV